jgi:hypothetical protein
MSATFPCEVTPASVWEAVAGGQIADELYEWRPDMFALTDVVLTRSEADRHALSPPPGLSWPPDHISDWAGAVTDAEQRWSAWVEDNADPIPDLIADEWDIREGAHLPLPRSRLTSALAGKVVILERAGFEVSLSARTTQAIDAVADVAAANAQLPPLTVELRHLVEWMIGAQRV